MITSEELIHGWNRAGNEVTADLLSWVLKQLVTQDDVSRHNAVMELVLRRVGENPIQGWSFAKDMANLIQRYSLENLKHGQTEKEKTS